MLDLCVPASPRLSRSFVLPAPVAAHPVLDKAVAVLLGSLSAQGVLDSGGKTSWSDQ